MRLIRQPLIPFKILLLAGFLVACSVQANTNINEFILLQDGTRTEAVLEFSQTPAYKLFALQAPNRAVLDIDAAAVASGLNLPAANGLVLSVRQGKTANGLRFVFDLASDASLSARVDTSTGKPRLVVAITAKGGSPAAILAQQTEPTVSPAPLASVPPPPPAASKPTPDLTVLNKSAPLAPAPDKPTTTPVSKAAPAKTVPGASNVGFAVNEDDVVQIDIDSSGAKPKTTVNPKDAKPASPLPMAKPPVAVSPQAPLPKKAKTVSDVLGASARKLIIAIDAGHGGKDPGALGGNGLREKEVTLRVAKELAAIINADPGMKAVLIRDDDTFVPLSERYQRARRAQADLFVSIHADAAENNAASGSSVYVLSTKGASSQAARWLADKENAADLVGGVSLDDKDRNLSAVLLDLSQSATLRMSEDAAGNVLQSLKDLGKAHKKEVEHANFVVLRSPDVPSMLIETGFITNAAEERKLADPEHRKRLAFAIAQGLRRFFIEQPLPGTYYARKPVPSTGVTAGGTGIIP
jgi:N-acetylmuramoyl-L-alanine amidase